MYENPRSHGGDEKKTLPGHKRFLTIPMAVPHGLISHVEIVFIVSTSSLYLLSDWYVLLGVRSKNARHELLVVQRLSLIKIPTKKNGKKNESSHGGFSLFRPGVSDVLTF